MMLRKDTIQHITQQQFDVVIIGAGASGLGCALDAASRGLSVAIVDAHDFCSGTSSKSSKLIHGGVRYLELAVKQFDLQQLQLVRDALKERAILLQNAPDIVKPLRLLTPCSSRLSAAYYWAGMKTYDALAGTRGMQASQYIGAQTSKRFHHFLNKEQARAMVAYSDGQFDDCALGMAMLKTAQQHGAICLNYAPVETITKNAEQNYQIKCNDGIHDQDISISCKTIINCAGPGSDLVRELIESDSQERIQRSIGSHIVIDKKFWPHKEALLIPKTKDGRVLFIIPWLDHVMIGTTDQHITENTPIVCTQDQAEYLIEHANQYFTFPITQGDILSAWAGVRPLLVATDSSHTAKIIRDHKVFHDDNGMFHLCGGKWTTYRLMAEDCVDQICKHLGISATCKSNTLALPKIHTGNNWNKLCTEAVQETGAQRIDDILARRSRIAFLNRQEALELVPSIAQHLQELLGWSQEQRASQEIEAHELLSREFSVLH